MKIFYIVLGLIMLALGSIGIVIPVLPTTPFLLVAAFCFTKSSKKLDTWFQSTKLYKNSIESLKKKEGLTKAAKIRITSSITAVFLIAAFFMRNTNIGLVCLAVVWVAHIIAFTFMIKTKVDAN